MTTTSATFIGKTYVFDYGDFVALDTFVSDEELTFEILSEGPMKGLTGRTRYQAKEIRTGVFLITWQESDGGTVVHIDDFENGISHSNYTDAKLNFYVMAGTIKERI
jgi:hypothetical protein